MFIRQHPYLVMSLENFRDKFWSKMSQNLQANFENLSINLGVAAIVHKNLSIMELGLGRSSVGSDS